MQDKHLHIISFDIPYPPDYGGVVDVFYKIKALSSLDIKIHLHCFEYGRKHAAVLNELCFSVNYYQRKTTKLKLLSKLPYIVSSRESEPLIVNLLKDDYPILMEGLHTTLYINDERLRGRKIIVRNHNIEHDYYRHLAASELNPFRKWFFKTESEKLLMYEKILSNASSVASISPADHQYINKNYGNSFYLPAFHPNEKINCLIGKGDYALYHGNLRVAENNQAALFLVKEVFNQLNYRLVIAGNNPSKELLKAVKNNSAVELKTNLSAEELQELIKQAHINVLPAFQSTGIKLKLINALFNGRFCVVNTMMVENTGLKHLCFIASTSEEWVIAISQMMRQEFSAQMIKEREDLLLMIFNNKINARKLIEGIYL